MLEALAALGHGQNEFICLRSIIETTDVAPSYWR